MKAEDNISRAGGVPVLDARDIALHLRSIHFSLLVVCVGLYALVTAGRPEEIVRARLQLAEIVALVSRWEPEWVAATALDLHNTQPPNEVPVAHGAGPLRLRIDQSWTLLPLPQALLDTAFPGAALDPLNRSGPLWSDLVLPKPKISANLPPQLTEFTPEVASLILPAPKTLKEFEAVWNALEEITLTLVEAQWVFPDIMGPTEGRLGQLPYAEVPPTGGITVSMRLEPIADVRQQSVWRDRVEHEWDPAYHFIGRIDPRVDGIAHLLPQPDRQSTPDFGLPWLLPAPEPAALSMAAEVETRAFNAQKAFVTHFGLHWRPGSYARNFPELSAVSAGNDDLYFDKVTALIKSKARQAEGKLTLFGFQVPVALVASWGVPIVLVSQLYFLVHLRSLRRCLTAGAAPKLAPWIGIYSDPFARTVAVASILALPPATLGMVIAPEVSTRPELAVGVVTSGLLGLVSIATLRQVWKNLGSG